MRRKKLIERLVLLVTVILLAAVLPASADSPPPSNIKNETLDDTADQITNIFRMLDLEVQEGYFQMWGGDECLATFDLMGSCFFNNPAAPYVFPVLPYWPDEFVDPATAGVFGETREGYGTTYRFDPHEAIIIFG
ncbi:MAG TPA: hypothetical protein VIM80_04730, partial [Brevefilum sp.]